MVTQVGVSHDPLQGTTPEPSPIWGTELYVCIWTVWCRTTKFGLVTHGEARFSGQSRPYKRRAPAQHILGTPNLCPRHLMYRTTNFSVIISITRSCFRIHTYQCILHKCVERFVTITSLEVDAITLSNTIFEICIVLNQMIIYYNA